MERVTDALTRVADPIALLRGLFAYAPVGFQVYDASGHSLVVNRAFLDLFGSEPPPEYNVLRDEIAAEVGVLDHIHRAFGGETVRIGPIWYDPRALTQVHVEEGHRVAMESTFFPIRDAAGAVTHVAIAFKDVTGDALVQEERDRWRALLEAAPDAILIVAEDGTIALANDQSATLFGQPEDALIGQPIEELFAEPHAGTLRRHVEGARSRLGMPPRADLRARRPDGTELDVEVSFAALPATGGPPEVIAAFRDVTAERRAKEEIRRLNVELEERVQSRTAELRAALTELEAFSYSVSHDLRAPLRTLDGFSQALLEDHAGGLDAVAVDYLQRIRAGAGHLGALIEDLLRLSRLARSSMEKQPIDLAETARALAETHQATAAGRRVDFRIPPSLPAEADPRLIRVALANLLENAVKFTSRTAAPRIEVGRSLHAGEGVEAFYVRDNGAGFDMAHAGKLFQAFQRLHDEAEFQGTGIGLATVKRVIDRHGGRIWAEGTAGQGACFWFTLG